MRPYYPHHFGPMEPGRMGHSFGWGFPLLGGLFWLLMVGLLVFLIVTVIRREKAMRHYTAAGLPAAAGQSPLDIAKTRYAKGEINKEEYEALRKDLE
jgi:putative membrane protein